MAEWSSLQRDILRAILEKLDVSDHARFARVCSSWRSAAASDNLSFVLSHEPDRLVRRFITSFIPSWNNARFIGALDRWLVILIDGRDLFLLNKVVHSIIPLPPPPDPSHFCESPEFTKAALSSPRLSSSSPSVVVLKHYYGGVFYCRLGGLEDKSFTKLSNCPPRPQDILFHKGRLYVLCYHDTNANTIVVFDRLLNKVSELVTDLGHNPTPRRLLISGNNNTLTVVAGRPRLYSVYTLEEGSEPRLVPMNNKKLVLLSNRYCSLSVTGTKELEEFRRRAGDRFENNFSNFVLATTSKDPNKVKADSGPWPLFFVMFSYHGIQNFANANTQVGRFRSKPSVENSENTNRPAGRFQSKHSVENSENTNKRAGRFQSKPSVENSENTNRRAGRFQSKPSVENSENTSRRAGRFRAKPSAENSENANRRAGRFQSKPLAKN